MDFLYTLKSRDDFLGNFKVIGNCETHHYLPKWKLTLCTVTDD